ncbi:MAG: mechanosensitive ion channel, partial [Clostridia bacterium]|nr:mechanosensitive ion channel [Clostridia bacterium]
FWNSIKNFFTDNVWNIVLFFAVLILGVVVIKIAINVIKRIFAKSKVEKIAQQFIVTVLKVLLYLVLVLALLSIIGVQITGIVTALSALLLAVGMALESNIANLANGIVIVATKMFKKGDYISVNGVEGSIADINFLFTTLDTTDNKKVTIPNSTIVNSSVLNAGANPRRRVEITFSVAYETDVETVKKLVTDVMKSNG